MDVVTPRPASIVIPAHNEATVIGRCLESLLADGAADAEVVVVANGCTDATADVARGFAERAPGLQVIDTPVAGKIGALNLGEAAVTAFPRIYLDADIELVGGAYGALVAALGDTVDAVAAPRLRLDTDGAGLVPKAFYEIYQKLPYLRRGLVGLGVYALSEKGRSRFGMFPDVIADDLFVQQLFAEGERLTTSGDFVVRVPRRTRELVKVRARGADGARQLAQSGLMPRSTASERGSSVRSLGLVALRRPWLLPQILVYFAVTVAGRQVASRNPGMWQRDETSRRASIDLPS